MSASAKIQIIGKPREKLLIEIQEIKKWDNGHNYHIEVWADHKFIMDTIENVENAINNDLAAYVHDNFILKNKILKSGGNDDLYIVPDLDLNGNVMKIRKKATNYTPKKRKRHKHKRC